MRILSILLLFILFSCKSETSPSLADQQKAMEFFKQGSDAMIKGFGLYADTYDPEQKSYGEHVPHFRKAIDLFMAAMNSDPGMEQYGIYMSDLYMGIRKYDSAIYWHRQYLTTEIHKKAQERNKDMPDGNSDSNLFFGKCFMFSGRWDSAKYNFQIAAAKSEEHEGVVGLALFEYARKLKDGIPAWDVEALPAHIDKCRYSIQIMELGRQLTKKVNWMTEAYFRTDSIHAIKKRCG